MRVVPTSLDDYVDRLLAESTPLTPEQLDRLAVLLRPAPAEARDAA